MEVEITTTWQVLDKILHIEQVSSRSSGVWHDVQNLQIPLPPAVSTWGSVFPAEGRASWLSAFSPCLCLLWSVGAAQCREQQLHAWTICFPVSMASVQGCFPVPWWVTSRRMRLDTHCLCESLTSGVRNIPQGSCFQGIGVSWKQAGGSWVCFLLPQLCHSLLPLPQPRLSQTCWLVEVSQHCSAPQAATAAGRGGEGQCLKKGRWICFSLERWKGSNSWNDSCFSSVLLLHLIFLTPVQSSQHGAALDETSKHQTSKYSWDPPPPLPFSCTVMRQPTQGRRREEIIQEWEGNALNFGKITLFHLSCSCSALPLWCLTASCQLLQGTWTTPL